MKRLASEIDIRLNKEIIVQRTENLFICHIYFMAILTAKREIFQSQFSLKPNLVPYDTHSIFRFLNIEITEYQKQISNFCISVKNKQKYNELELLIIQICLHLYI